MGGLTVFVLLAVFSLQSVLATQAAAAPPRRYRLKYTVAPGLRCPARSQVKSEVASRMAHDPWSRRSRRVIHVQVTTGLKGMVARIWIRKRSGRKVGRRTFRSVEGECKELMEHVAFHLALVLDPLSLRRPRPKFTPRPPPPPVKPPARPAPPSPTPKVRTRTRVGTRGHLALSVGGVFVLGAAAGNVSGGLTAQVRYRFWKMSLGVEGRVDLPAQQDNDGVDQGRIATTLMTASVLPCFHRRWLAVCGVLTAGAIRGQPRGLNDPNIETLPYLAGGVRAGAELALTPTFTVRIYGDLVAPVPVTFKARDPSLLVFWTSPAVNGALGVALAAGFL